MALENLFGELALDETLDRRFFQEREMYSDRLTADHEITPSLGKRIRVFWISVLPATLPVAVDPVGNKVVVKFLSNNKGYTGEVITHWQCFTGEVDEALDISLSSSEPVDINIHYEEI